MKDYDVKYLDVNTGERIAYREAGSGDKVVLLLHGNMTSSVHCQPLMELLEKDYKVYAPDMVGFGDSSYKRQINSLHDFSKDITAFIEKLDLNNIFILGWSTGGGVVLETAADIPERISKIFLMSSVGIQGYYMYKKDEQFKPILSHRIFKREDIAADPVQTLPTLQALKNANRDFMKKVWDLSIYTQKQPHISDYKKYVDAMLKQRNLIDVNYSLANFNMTHDSNGVVEGSGRIDLVKAPVVIFHGTNDLVVPFVFAETTKKYFGDQAELISFENAGHSLMTDCLQDLYNEMVKRID